jgi:hypothetical protein
MVQRRKRLPTTHQLIYAGRAGLCDGEHQIPKAKHPDHLWTS